MFALLAFQASKAQDNLIGFDSVQFNHNLLVAGWLVDCDYVNEISVEAFKKKKELPPPEWFSYYANAAWYIVGGNFNKSTFTITSHLIFDTLFNATDYSGRYDSAKLAASFSALTKAGDLFRVVRDTSSIYFSSFVYPNPDQTISVWFLPALQPSGQALYGCEWEYIFNNTGETLLKLNSVSNPIRGIWIGQPREFWLNYRNQDLPTIGSLYFVLSFRDFFTRMRINTGKFTSTVAKNTEGIYEWTHLKK